MNVLVFGEILWDMIEGESHLGGAPLNFAAHITQCGGTSAIISSLGKDEMGEKALALVEARGINTRLIQRSDKQTGFVPVTVIDGQPEYEIIEDVAFDDIRKEVLLGQDFCHFDLFYFGSLIQRSLNSAESLQMVLGQCSFAELFYDVNLRKNCYSKEVISYSLSYCTILKVNDEEVEVLSKMLFESSYSFEEFCLAVTKDHDQIQVVIITAGAEGCFVYCDGNLINVPTDPIKVVDTVGAGDSFSAAFASVFIQTKDPIKAAKIANKVGGYVASSTGAIPEYSEQINALLQDI